MASCNMARVPSRPLSSAATAAAADVTFTDAAAYQQHPQYSSGVDERPPLREPRRCGVRTDGWRHRLLRLEGQRRRGVLPVADGPEQLEPVRGGQGRQRRLRGLRRAAAARAITCPMRPPSASIAIPTSSCSTAASATCGAFPAAAYRG